MDIDGYSARAETFATDFARRYYRRFAGLGADESLGAPYRRSAELFGADAVARLREAGATGERSARRRARMLLRFAADGHLGRATAQPESELVRRESEVRVAAPDGQALRLGDVAGAQAREADPLRRAELEAERCRVTGEALAPIALEIVQARHAAAHELGWRTYAAMYADLHAVDFAPLRAQAERFLAATEGPFAAIVAPAVRATLGLQLGALARGDLPRLFREPALDGCFPAAGLAAALTDTLADLGVDLPAQPNVVLDLAPRSAKSRRAFCAPVRVPQEIYLVLAANGGREDYAALLHEAGHAEHFAFADPQLAFELRRFGDPAIGEAFAFLLERIADEPAWLADRGVDSPGAMSRARRLLFLRRYAAKLCYELELHGGDLDAASAGDRYAAHLSRAMHLSWPSATWLTDLDPGLYVAHYLRAWALESRLRTALRERFGPAWFRSPAAGGTLRAWWRDSHGLCAEEFVAEVDGGGPPDFAALAGEFAAPQPPAAERAADERR